MSEEKSADEAVSSAPKSSVTFAPTLNGSEEPATSSELTRPPLPSSGFFAYKFYKLALLASRIRATRFTADDDGLNYPPKPARTRVQFSPESEALIAESKKLLQMQ
jgi:hypothetical protein